MVKSIIFDVDGTLVDTREDIWIAVNHVLKNFGKSELTLETVTSYLGKGVKVLIEKSTGYETGTTEHYKAVDQFNKYYEEHITDNSKLFPGVKELLSYLSDRILCISTNKPIDLAYTILENLQVRSYFKEVYGGGSFKKLKPDPSSIKAVMEKYNLEPDEVILVGDSNVDIETAANAGIKAYAVTYGYTDKDDFRWYPEKFLEDILELKEYI